MYGLAGGAFAVEFVEDYFAEADVVGGYLYVFVFFYVFEGFFEGEDYGGDDAGFVVGAACAHVGELL